ncbi:DUF4175 family protein [Rapidithrix thailandica]|uniref:DUF4175 family protein n=1 Tax=Rapidithrix thailandica TaxID=413964 RepID=A0AAW9RXH2_9BACT
MLEKEIRKYKRKYYLNALIKGSIFAVSLVLTLFLLVNTIEYFGSLNTTLRAVLFFTFLSTTVLSFYFWLFRPLYTLFNSKKQLSDLEAAERIGKFFPTVGDRLINILQLKKHSQETDLVHASIQQKEAEIHNVSFTQAVDYKTNKKYAKYLVTPFFCILLLLLIIPQIFTESTPRIINYSTEYKKKAPFSFGLLNENLSAFRNDDLPIQLQLDGIAIPQDVQLITADGRKVKMENLGDGNFQYTFKKIQRDIDFHFEASGFASDVYQISVFSRPNLKNFSVYLDFPAYIKKSSEQIENTGNLIIPEGTKIKWQFKTQEADSLELFFVNSATSLPATEVNENVFETNKKASLSDTYQVLLENKHSKNKDIIEYYLNVVPDEHPTIDFSHFEDTVLYDYLILGGNIGDDYGITGLNLKYRISERGEGNQKFQTLPIAYNPKIINQSYFHKLELKELNIRQGQNLEYFVEVWDNDGVNGRKSSRTSTFVFKLPSKEEFKAEIEKDSQETENQIDNSLNKAKELKEEINNIQDRLKGKKKLDWQDKKSIEDLINRKEELNKQIEDLQKANELFNQKQEKFNFHDEKLSQKAQQLQKLMDELLDEETKKLYEELNKLLNQNFINKNLQETLENLEFKEDNLEKELDRALELFKKLKFDTKANEIIEDLEKLSQEQEELSEETKDSKKSDTEQIQEKQDNLDKEFEDVQKEMEELDKLNEEQKNPKDLEPFDQPMQDIKQQQQNTQQMLQDKKMKKASDSQKQSSQQMQQMSRQMQQMQESMEMQRLNENYDDLRKILENLLKLSFDQEDLMLEFQKIKKIDPKFIELSQQQLKLKDDARVIEDSLLSLAKRVFQIESFVTREVAEMNKYMEESVDAIKKRTPEIAASKQQFTMTSVNNLALLLNDILQSMQQQMSQSMSGQQMSEKQNGSPQLSDLQQQLNQKIRDLKKSGKTGRQLSKELAKLAAEQEMIRNALKQGMGQDKIGGEKPGEKEGENGRDGGYGKLLEEMEKTEEDLINKRITQETINRQKEILTRLLESEKADKERELDNKRKAETAKQQFQRELPEEFSEYLKSKEMQIELLKTIPASLNQYYKNEVNEYFKKLKH